jgi:hypothetical protein
MLYEMSELKAMGEKLGENALEFGEPKKEIQWVREFITRALKFGELERNIVLNAAEHHIQRVRYNDE